MSFQRALDFTLGPEIEDGYSDRSSADDPGGRTYRGISERAHPDAWAQGRPSDEMVVAIYRNHYWDPLSADALPFPVAVALFDFAVNSGVARAALELQSLVGAQPDGKIGPATQALVAKACKLLLGAELLALRLIVRRHEFMLGRSNYEANKNGWSKRLVLLNRFCVAERSSS